MATETDTTVETNEPVSLSDNIAASLEKLIPADDATETANETKDAAAEHDTKAEETPAKGADDDESGVEDEEQEDDAPESDDDEEDEDEDDEPDEEFQAAVEKHKIPTKLEDLPEEARPFVQKKLKAMESGYTRAMQEARSYRQEKAAFDAERAYERDHRDQAIADALAADPTLIDKVNAELERRKDPTYATAIAKDREVTKREAELTARETLAQQEARNARGEEIETYTRDAAKAAGVPFELIEPAVVLAITSNPGKEFTEAQVDAIIAEKAKVYAKHVGAIKGAKTREYAKAKANDAKTAGVLKPRSSTGVRPSADRSQAAKPKDLRSFVSNFVDNYQTQ